VSAPVSGPGKFSRRTDNTASQPQRDMSGLPYGDNGAFRTQQASAPMAAATPVDAAAPPATPMPPIPSPADPSQRPDEPVTAGAARGPGPNGLSMSMPGAPVGGQISRTLRQLAASDPTGTLAALASEAERRGQ
jgi:hypothetical protein